MWHRKRKQYITKNFIYNVAKFTGLTFYEVDSVISNLIEEMMDELENGNNIYFSGWGSFMLKKYKKTRIRHLGNIMDISERIKIKFIPRYEVKNAIKHCLLKYKMRYL